MLRPNKTISNKWYLGRHKVNFQINTKHYVVSGAFLGALLEAGYRVKIRDTQVYINCSAKKLPGYRNRMPNEEYIEYKKIAQDYTQLGFNSEGSYWMPELYSGTYGSQAIKAKYNSRLESFLH